MALFKKRKASTDASEKKTLAEGIFRKCDACGATLLAGEFAENLEVCPSCGKHERLSGEAWVSYLLDPGSWQEHDAELVAENPLEFVDSKTYPDRIAAAKKKAGVNDAILTGSGKLDGRDVQFGVFLFRFMGGSMGSVVGERITRMLERALEEKTPAILLASSGGARMQEGALSLMQMAKTVSALERLRDANLPFISVMLNPTTGGVAASFAFLGDINVAEPGALIGFAGARVIETTIRQTLPEGFQRAEFLLEHGMIDMIVPRAEMRATLARSLDHLLG